MLKLWKIKPITRILWVAQVPELSLDYCLCVVSHVLPVSSFIHIFRFPPTSWKHVSRSGWSVMPKCDCAWYVCNNPIQCVFPHWAQWVRPAARTIMNNLHNIGKGLWAHDHHTHMCLLRSHFTFCPFLDVIISSQMGRISIIFWSAVVWICPFSQKNIRSDTDVRWEGLEHSHCFISELSSAFYAGL